MKICSIHIKGYRQFQDTYIDFTDPETGEPSNKICFIGNNGTGKSTLLRLIDYLISNQLKSKISKSGLIIMKLRIGKNDALLMFTKKLKGSFLFSADIETKPIWRKMLSESFDEDSFDEILEGLHELEYGKYLGDPGMEKEYAQFIFLNDISNLLILSPSESVNNQGVEVKDVPDVSLDEALSLFTDQEGHHIVSDETITDFWKLLIYHLKQRDEEREGFENQPENLDKTKKQLIEEFDAKHPKILDKIALLWNRILKKAGLEFDVENASKPIQLTDNLKAYIRLKDSKERINYNQLSSGIRNFIFRIGHIYSLYFNREIKKGFLLVDEPENSLFPDFLYDLVDIYQEIVVDKNGENNTQVFMATHNPIIAAQFEPHERIILEWDENGSVSAHKGSSPVGDDPNNVLMNDFQLRNLLGQKGQKKWEEYLLLKKKLRKTDDVKEKEELMSKIFKIGSDYNFKSK